MKILEHGQSYYLIRGLVLNVILEHFNSLGGLISLIININKALGIRLKQSKSSWSPLTNVARGYISEYAKTECIISPKSSFLLGVDLEIIVINLNIYLQLNSLTLHYANLIDL